MVTTDPNENRFGYLIMKGSGDEMARFNIYCFKLLQDAVAMNQTNNANFKPLLCVSRDASNDNPNITMDLFISDKTNHIDAYLSNSKDVEVLKDIHLPRLYRYIPKSLYRNDFVLTVMLLIDGGSKGVMTDANGESYSHPCSILVHHLSTPVTVNWKVSPTSILAQVKKPIRVYEHVQRVVKNVSLAEQFNGFSTPSETEVTYTLSNDNHEGERSNNSLLRRKDKDKTGIKKSSRDESLLKNIRDFPSSHPQVPVMKIARRKRND